MRTNKTRMLLPAALVLVTATAQAQNITGYRYWFNDDVASAVTVDVTPTPELDAALSLNSAALPAGHHLATIQFRDADGHWGAPWTEHFTQKGGTVNAIEYWFDDNAGDATTANMTPGTAPLYSTPLDATALPVGFHSVTVRTMDASGERGVPYTVPFARNGGMITGYEYWLDEAIADRTTGSIGPAGVVDLVAGLPVPTTDGTHLFTIRFRDEDGGWSVPLSSTFNYFVGMDEIPGLSNYLVFPNPAVDVLSIRLDAARAGTLDLSILDATGRRVGGLNKWSVLGTAQHNLDISTLARGSYQLLIAEDTHQVRVPFVKQ